MHFAFILYFISVFSNNQVQILHFVTKSYFGSFKGNDLNRQLFGSVSVIFIFDRRPFSASAHRLL